MKKCLLVLLFAGLTSGQFGDFEQDFGHITVRDGAHMFYWLFYTTANVTSYTERPLMIWLQGGPGGSSTAIGNFEILGPLDLSLQERNYSWVKEFNVLFVDNPVGTGFSYVDNLDQLCTDNACVATDFVNLMRGIFERHPEFQTVPMYIYGQSYGGKMAVDISLQLIAANNNGSLQSNLRGMAMGNAWIHPVYLTYGWSDILYKAGLIEDDGKAAIEASAAACEGFYNAGSWNQMINAWYNTQYAVFQYTGGVDFYDIANKYPSNAITKMMGDNAAGEIRKMLTRDISRAAKNDEIYDLDYIMNVLVKPALNIPENVVWDSLYNQVFNAMVPDFMTPVTEGVERLLNETDIVVVKYNGNMDLICETSGQLKWVEELNWPGAESYKASARQPIWVDGRLEGYYKSQDNFRFYWINTAGHSVPRDNPFGTSAFLQDMTGFGGY